MRRSVGHGKAAELIKRKKTAKGSGLEAATVKLTREQRKTNARRKHEATKKEKLEYISVHGNRRTRRHHSLYNPKGVTTMPEQKCKRNGCANDVGVVSSGQQKDYCSKDCRKMRHNSKKAKKG